MEENLLQNKTRKLKNCKTIRQQSSAKAWLLPPPILKRFAGGNANSAVLCSSNAFLFMGVEFFLIFLATGKRIFFVVSSTHFFHTLCWYSCIFSYCIIYNSYYATACSQNPQPIPTTIFLLVFVLAVESICSL